MIYLTDKHTKFINSYLKIIKLFHIQKNKHEKDHKIFEYLIALELGLIHWDDLPPDFDEIFDIPHTMDYGVD